MSSDGEDDTFPVETSSGPLWIDISDLFANSFSTIDEATSLVPGKSYCISSIRRTGVGRTGIYNPLEVSLRFFQTQFPGTFLEILMARRFAYIAWRINALQRWLGKEVTEFEFRDRVTQDKYTLETDPDALGFEPTGDWYSPTNLDSLLALITDQIRQGRGGGPSGQGAHNSYEHLFIKQAREAIPDLIKVMWADPPDGPGKGGAIFGAKWITMNADGERGFVGHTLCGGARYPLSASSLIGSTSSNWDYASGDDVPQEDHYMPIERIMPNDDCHTGYFEAMKFRMGTTTNANRYPPDVQLLSEFNLSIGTMPNVPHDIQSILNTLDEQDAPPGELIPPEGNGEDAQNYWVVERGDSKRFAPGDSDYYYTWNFGPNNNQVFGYCYASNAFNVKLFPNPVHTAAIQFRRGWRRHGFELDIQGKPWNLSYWDWFSAYLGAVPEAMYVKGTVNVFNTEDRYSTKCALGWTQKQHDEDVARMLMPESSSDFDPLMDDFETDDPDASMDIDVDVSDLMRGNGPSGGALCFGFNFEFTIADDIGTIATTIGAGCSFNQTGGAGIGNQNALPGNLEAEFPGGQRVAIVQI